MEKLMLFGIENPGKIETLEKIARRRHLPLIVIDKADYGKPLGTLAGYQLGDLPLASACALPQAGVLLLCNLKNSKMDALLSDLRRTGFEQMFKAVLTAANARWNIYQLAEQLRLEREKTGAAP